MTQPLHSLISTLRASAANDAGDGSNAKTPARPPVAFAAISEYGPTFAPMS